MTRFVGTRVCVGVAAVALGACTSTPKQTTGTVQGQVTVSGAQDNAALVSIPGQAVQTGPDGVFTFPNVPAGTLAVTATRSGYAVATQAVAVTAGQTTTVTLTLSPTASVPTLSSFSAVPETVAPSGTIQLLAVASDPAGGALTYTFSALSLIHI